MHAIFAVKFGDAHRGLPARAVIATAPRCGAPSSAASAFRRRSTYEHNGCAGALTEQLRDACGDLDAVSTPTTPMAAYPIDQLSSNRAGDLEAILVAKTRFTVPFSLTGQPAISVPCGVTGEGLPVGVQIVGALNADGQVLRIARRVEALVASAHRPGMY